MTNEQYINAVNLYSDSLFRIAYSICRNKQDAEDAVQNSFLKLYTSKVEFLSDEHIKNYLVKIAVNYCKHNFTSSWKQKVILTDNFVSDEYYTMDDKDDHYILYSAVMSLPYKYRIVVHLYYYEDYSVKEISTLISEKETTVQTRLMRARNKLKSMLQEEWEDEIK